MDKKELLGRLWAISEGKIPDGDERVLRTLGLARRAVDERIETDALAYLTVQLVRRVYEEEAPGWLVNALFSLWVLLGKFYGKRFVGQMDQLLDAVRQDLAVA